MSTKTIPENLKEKQEKQKLDTINKIQNAIDVIQEEGGIVTKKKLIEMTSLSNATFSKPHVKEVLKANKVCQFKNIKQIIKNNDEALTEQLYLKISKLERENNLLNSKLQDKEIIISKIKNDYEELKKDYDVILGKIHFILRKIDERDIDLGIDLDNL